MKQRALVFVRPQTPDNFLSVYMAGCLSIVELQRWASDIFFRYDIALFGANDNFVAANDDQAREGPEDVA